MAYESKFKRADIDELFEAILLLEDQEDCYRFFEDVCTIKEIRDISQRLQIADDKPIAIFKNYLVPELVPDIESYVGKFAHLYDFLEEHYGLCIDAARDRISARSATFEEASMLDVPVGSALIYLVRVCYSGDRIVGSDHCRILGSRYEFEIYMNGRYRKN